MSEFNKPSQPAFPALDPDGDCDPYQGISRREYFAAHAPSMPDWFKPSLKDRPEDKWTVKRPADGETIFNALSHPIACDYAKQHGSYVWNDASDDIAVYLDECREAGLFQWPWYYADMMLKARDAREGK